MQAYANAGESDIMLPGNEIPEWFNHQRYGNRILVSLLRDIWNDSQWIGVVFCCVFVNVEADIDCNVFIHDRNSWEIGSWGLVLQ